jgi:hypothetical protein
MKQIHRSDAEVFEYTPGKRSNTASRRYRKLRRMAGTYHCDNRDCEFHAQALIWNGKPLALIVDHKDGAACNSRLSNLRLLCPNCDSQNETTRGGANARRVRNTTGGYQISEKDGRVHYKVMCMTIDLRIAARNND